MLSYLSSCRSRSLTLSKQSRICLSTVKVSKREKKQQENTSLLIAEAKKSNIAQSPLKIKFLVKLINHSWVPDALAQLKFSPKHRAVDVEKIVRRASSLAKLYYDAIPEELIVKEVIVTKGIQQKKMHIMGRGRTGFGYTRKSHVTVKVQKIDFDAIISNSKTPVLQSIWRKRSEMVAKLKEEAQQSAESAESPPSPSS